MSEKVTFLDALANSAFTKQCGKREYFISCRLEEMADNDAENQHRNVRQVDGEVSTSRKSTVPVSASSRAIALAGIESRVRAEMAERVPAKQILTTLVKPGVVKRSSRA